MLFNGAGFYVYYFVKLQQIRMEMREALKFLPEHQLDVLKMTENEFRVARVEEHEVKVNGRMYDIACIAAKGDSVTVYGKHDEKEDNLIALLDHVITAPMKAKDPTSSVTTTFILLIFIKPASVALIFSRMEVTQPVTFYFFHTKTFNHSPDSPPPWR